MAKIYTITVTLDDITDGALSQIFAKSGKTVQQVLQEAYTGYDVDGKHQNGMVQLQLNQWVIDEITAEIKGMESVTALSKLKA
jgi:hypothetical protein